MSWRTTVLAGLSVLAAILTISNASVAQEAAAEPGRATSEAAAEPDAKQPAGEVRRDPRGVTGISPFWEALVEGDRAYVARSFPSSIEAYKKAIAAEPNNPMGYYRIGQAHVAAGELAEAEEAYKTALSNAGSDPKLKAKILFVIADLRERQKDNAGAIEQWDAYGEHVKQGDAGGYPATAGERKQVNAKWQELVEKYAEVKARIQKREEEAEAQLKKSSR